MVSASSRALTARSQVLSSSEAGQHTRAHAQKNALACLSVVHLHVTMHDERRRRAVVRACERKLEYNISKCVLGECVFPVLQKPPAHRQA